MKGQLGILGLLCLVALGAFGLNSYFPTQLKRSNRSGQTNAEVRVLAFDSRGVVLPGTSGDSPSQSTAELDGLSPACAEAILEFGRAFRDLVRLDEKAIDSRPALKELLSTKVVHDLAYNSPCTAPPLRWSWLEAPMTIWAPCFEEPPVLDPLHDPKGQFPRFNFNPCEFVVSTYLVASTYLELRGQSLQQLTDTSVIKRMLAAQALMMDSLGEAEALARRWLVLEPESPEAKYELTALTHARAVLDQTPERVAIYEQALRDYMKSPDPDNTYSRVSAEMELFLLKGEFKELYSFAGYLADNDMRKAYYMALAAYRMGNADAAAAILRKDLDPNDLERQSILRHLAKGDADNFLQSKPLSVIRTFMGSQGMPALHTWFMERPIELSTVFVGGEEVPIY